MANIFISYGDERFKESLNRIARQAKKVGIFDKIIKYTPNDLPEYVKASPLFAFNKGGGYWCWKPWVIIETHRKCNIGDVVFYCDAGCTLQKDSSEWGQFLEVLKSHNAIFFQYRDGVIYPWGINSDKVAIKHWMKPSAVAYMSQFIDFGFLDYGKIWAGFMIFKKTEHLSLILDQWYKITLFHPELIMDAYGHDLTEDNTAYHTCDQAILAPLIYHLHKEDHALVLPETSESRIGNPAVLGTRWMQGEMKWLEKLKYKAWILLHGELKAE